MLVKVRCYSGHLADEQPTEIQLGHRRVNVQEVLDRWVGADHRYIKMRGDDRGIYIVRHDTKQDIWELTLFANTEIREWVATTGTVHRRT